MIEVRYVDNACCIYRKNNFQLLADPWLTNGAFEGSWYHQTDAATLTDEELKSVDALFISHLHPDHFDPATLNKLAKSIPVLVLDKAPNFLHNRIESLGFTNLIKLKSGESAVLGDMKVTMYEPFVRHPFDESVLGNFLDSAIVLEDEDSRILNANDNTPDETAAIKLRAVHGEFTLLQLKYALAGPYPSCFTSLSHEEKLSEKTRLLSRLKSAMDKVAEILGGTIASFAGSYCLAGSLAWKNQYLAVDGLDLAKIPDGKKYSYEKETSFDAAEILDLCHQARKNLLKKQRQFKFFPKYSVSIQVFGAGYFKIDFEYPTAALSISPSADLICHLDPVLLKQILVRKSHWNNAEVGCHIDFHRTGTYNPDISTMMSFFHV